MVAFEACPVVAASCSLVPLTALAERQAAVAAFVAWPVSTCCLLLPLLFPAVPFCFDMPLVSVASWSRAVELP